MSPQVATRALLVLLGWAGTQEVPERQRARYELLYMDAASGLHWLCYWLRSAAQDRAHWMREHAERGLRLEGAFTLLAEVRRELKRARHERDVLERERDRLRTQLAEARLGLDKVQGVAQHLLTERNDAWKALLELREQLEAAARAGR